MNFKEIEKKWQEKWAKENTFKFDENNLKDKLYCLIMFPYPSGAKLHMGHWWQYSIPDSWVKMQRMQGANVFFPMGFDAFGLPAENYAIKTGIHPSDSTNKNIETMEEQFKNIGVGYNWEYEVKTCNPDYYKWTQWMFAKLYEKGLAYKKEAPVNWCPSCNTVLANEQVINGECERCCSQVLRKKMSQWFFKITDYAEELLNDLDKIDWPERTKNLQRNWIGKSKGAYVDFKIDGMDESFRVFTTRADTLFGATYCVLAPEHELVDIITTKEQKKSVENYKIEAAKQSEIERTSTVKEKTGVFTGAYAINPVNNEKVPVWIADYVLATYGTGAIMAVPAHDERDYDFAVKFNLPIIPVIAQVTGERKDNEIKSKGIIAVVYDEKEDKYLTINWHEKGGRVFIGEKCKESESYLECALRGIKEKTGYVDLEFVRETFPIEQHNDLAYAVELEGLLFKLKSDKQERITLDEEQINTFTVEWVDQKCLLEEIKDEVHQVIFENLTNNKPYIGDGIHINSGFLNGLNLEDSLNKMYDWLKDKACGEATINYKLRDWLVSRQRYWGAPIPIIYCDKCGTVLVPEKDLPVELPYNAKFTPDGVSPLAKSEEFVNCICPKCGGSAKREVDTLDTFVCSSWYFLRFPDAKNSEKPFDKDKINKFLPVDTYIGGIEHACMHLLYARFFTKALRDMGYLDFDEPFKTLIHQGLVLGSDGEKMSKSKGNTVAPEEYVEKYGSDVLRMYLMFGFNYLDGGPWNDEGALAIQRFLNRVIRLFEANKDQKGEMIPEVTTCLHSTIKAVKADVQKFQFNTAVARIMEYVNAIYKYQDKVDNYYIKELILILAPFAPHIAEELWEILGNKTSIFLEKYPEYDESLTISNSVQIGIQVNGKLRGSLEVTDEMSEDDIKSLAKEEANVKKHLENMEIIKIIYINKKIISIVAK